MASGTVWLKLPMRAVDKQPIIRYNLFVRITTAIVEHKNLVGMDGGVTNADCEGIK